jgi:hypothetical protein
MKKRTLFRAIKKGILRASSFILILAAIGICIPAYASGEHQPANGSAGSQLKTSQVCMMNNKYFGTEQIPVPVSGKTYYGCCAGCAASLQANTNNIRYSRDPYSGEEVDKAEAFIALKSPATKEVLYFKSEENYKGYSETLNSQNMSKA